MGLERFCEPDNFVINNVLGQVFEKHINKKETGAYYTDINTTQYITETSILSNIIVSWASKDKAIETYISAPESHSLETYIAKNNSLFILLQDLVTNSNNLDLIREIVKSIKVLDPTCGSGAFVFSAYKVIKKVHNLLRIQSKQPFQFIMNNNIFGIDLDKEAIEILTIRLCIEGLKLNVDCSGLANNFYCDNTLTSSIFDNHKFDCIIGNPPYLEYRKVKHQYSLANYQVKKCNNLYAFVLEKSLRLLKEGGYMGMIIPISYISTKRMFPIRDLLIKNSKIHFCASFADRPSCLFNGVHQKLNIIFLQKKTSSVSTDIYTSNYKHWLKKESVDLFNQIYFIKNTIESNDFIYKIGNTLEHEIIDKIINRSRICLIDNCVTESSHKVYLNMRMAFWGKAFNVPQKSREYKEFNFANAEEAALFTLIVNSNLYFFFWESISDAWHITNKDLSNFKVDFKEFSSAQLSQAVELCNEINLSLEKTKKYIGSVQTDYEYQHKKIKHTIDKIDDILSNYFNFNNQEKNYIRNYQLKYRLNDEFENYMIGK
nr:N-6 DNA methylase [Psychrosphaera sp. F3M07]